MASRIDGKAVCNCPSRGKMRQCKMRHEPVVGYRPTRLGVLRIEDMDSRIRLADARTHGHTHMRPRVAPLPWGPGLATHQVLSWHAWVSAPALDPPSSDT